MTSILIPCWKHYFAGQPQLSLGRVDYILNTFDRMLGINLKVIISRYG